MQQQTVARVLTAGGGFLLAVLWMDLMFDVQYFGDAPAVGVQSMAAYYHRVTLDAGWMTYLVAAVMLVTIAGVIVQLRRSSEPRWRRITIAALALVPIALALSVVLPAARELATTAAVEDRLLLARTIAVSHIACFASIATFIGVQLRQAV